MPASFSSKPGFYDDHSTEQTPKDIKSNEEKSNKDNKKKTNNNNSNDAKGLVSTYSKSLVDFHNYFFFIS